MKKHCGPGNAYKIVTVCALWGAVALGGCATTSTNVEHVRTRPTLMGQAALSYAVWTPPDFREDEALPLVVFLHGGGDDPVSLERHGLAERLAEATARGEIPRVVMVLPQGDLGFWMNWYDGSRRYEDWIVRALVPEVQQRWHTARCPEACHLMGVSMGGAGVLRYALHHKERFASVSALSAPVFDVAAMRRFANNRLFAAMVPMERVFGPDVSSPALWREDFFEMWNSDEAVGMPIFVSWGSNDRAGINRGNQRFMRHAERHGLRAVGYEYDGDHSWRSWAPVIENALRVQVGGQSLEEARSGERPEGAVQ